MGSSCFRKIRNEERLVEISPLIIYFIGFKFIRTSPRARGFVCFKITVFVESRCVRGVSFRSVINRTHQDNGVYLLMNVLCRAIHFRNIPVGF